MDEKRIRIKKEKGGKSRTNLVIHSLTVSLCYCPDQEPILAKEEG